MSKETLQTQKMKWVLFWVFVVLFVLIVLGTLGAVFLNWGKVQSNERDILFKMFLVEIGLAVAALFYSIFDLKERKQQSTQRLRLHAGEQFDAKKFVGKKATLSTSDMDGESLDTLEVTIIDDNGPIIPLKLPDEAYSVLVSISLGPTNYTGSFILGTHLLHLKEA